MSPRLRVVAGTSLDSLHPITVNTGTAHHFTSDAFEGSVAAYVKDFPGPDDQPLECEYFNRADRSGVTWSIQVQGRFLQPISADDVLFGNTFDRPLQLPWGAGAAFRFMKYIDPTLEHDLASKTRPWALSPLISTMPHLTHARLNEDEQSIAFPPTTSLKDDVSQLHLAARPQLSSSPSSAASSASGSSLSVVSVSSRASSQGSDDADKARRRLPKLSVGAARQIKSRIMTHRKSAEPGTEADEDALVKGIRGIGDARQRRALFSNADNRKEIVFGPEDVITTDFCYGFIQFAPSLSLQLPGGVSFDLMKYWDGQPVRFMCCERKGASDADEDDNTPWGRVFWCVAIELLQDGPGASST